MTGNPAGQDDLRDLQQLWQHQSPLPALDVRKLRASLRRQQRHTRLMMVLDGLAVLVGAGLVGWMVHEAPSAKVVAWAGLVSVLIIAAAAASAVIRARVWSAADAAALNVAAMVEASIGQIHASLAIVRLCRWMVGISFLLLVVWGLFEYSNGELQEPSALRRRLTGFGLAFLYGMGFVAWGVWQTRRKRRELARLTAAAQELSGAG